MLYKVFATSALVVATQLLSVSAIASSPALNSVINFLSTPINALTKCVDSATADNDMIDLNGKWYAQMVTKDDNEAGLRCETHTFRSIGGKNFGLNTRKAATDKGPLEVDFITILLENGRFRQVVLPYFLSFGIVNFVYFDCRVGYILQACAWNDNEPIPQRIYLVTKHPNPSEADMQTLIAEAEKAGFNTNDLRAVTHTNCSCEREDDLSNKVLSTLTATISYLLCNQVKI